nr:translocation/assembly module TamB domain-containing protein [Lysobacter sp. CFH 32150]
MSRRRKIYWGAGFGGIALVLLFALFVYWLLNTIGGRDLLLSQIVARLPEGTTLHWDSAEGPAAGPLTLHGVRFEHLSDVSVPGKRLVFNARTVTLDPAIRPLLGRRLRLDALAITGAALEIPESDEPFELPRWPESLPHIDPPLALQADAFRIDGFKVTRDGQPLIDIEHARGGIDASSGALHVEHLTVDSDRGQFTVHGDYMPRDDYRSDLLATAVLPASTGRTPLRLGLVARGDLARMDVAIAGRAPAPLRASLVLRGKDDPRWSARAKTDALDLAMLMGEDDAGTPLAFDLRANGVGGHASVQGKITQGEFVATIQPSQVSLEDQVLRVAPLVIDALEGRTTLRGHADLRVPENSNLRFAINARGLTWGGANNTPSVIADADFGIAGKPEAWAAIGNARIVRDQQRADVRFDGRGDREQVAIRSLRATMPTGTLEAGGSARWSPQLGWDLKATLAGFDPGYFFPGWNGAVNGKLATRGAARDGGGFDASLDVPQLGGRLRGRALAGHGKFVLRGEDVDGDLALSLGNSRIEAKGRVGKQLAVDARFAPLHLNDLWPDAAGTLRGTLALSGARDAPNVDADLDANGLRWGDYRAESLQAHGRLPWRGGNGAITIDAQGLDVGIALDSLRVNARGAVEQLQLEGDVRSEFGTLALSGNANKRGNTWRGALASLQLAPVKGATWRLQQPARFSWTSSSTAGRNGALSRACLDSSGGGALCASADWPRRGLDVDGNGLPLTLLTPYLPERDDGRQWLLRGEIAIDGQLRPVGNSWRGNAKISSASGGLKLSEGARREIASYDNLALDAVFDPQRITAILGTTLNTDGRVDARISTGWDEYAPLAGEVALNTDELTWMELFSPDIVEPKGRLDGRIALGGTRAQPTLGGQAHLSEFNTELPALAITLQQGDVRLDAQPDGSARIRGSLKSGDGTLNLDGTLGWYGNDTPLVLNVRGANVLASDTRDLRAVIDPDVVVRYTAEQPLNVTGTVGVPSARIDLERLDEGVSASPDVVVLDPVDPKRGVATPLDLDLTLALGDDVKLNGFGLDGTLTGSLRVRQRPGREMTANGTLETEGRYTAYGQELTITRGELNWSNNAIANPALNIRAERVVGDVTAGIQVSGRATAPQAQVWANPAMDESEALAYLALGRPLSTASDAEGRQLSAASAALSAGSSLLASQLGARIGLDDAGVMQSRALGGSVFGVGKYLSPKLYVGYGVSLLGTGQVLTLKYLLRKGFDIQIESSTLENRASVNWRKEK